MAERDGVSAMFAHQIRLLAGAADIALGIDVDGKPATAISSASSRSTVTSTAVSEHVMQTSPWHSGTFTNPPPGASTPGCCLRSRSAATACWQEASAAR